MASMGTGTARFRAGPGRPPRKNQSVETPIARARMPAATGRRPRHPDVESRGRAWPVLPRYSLRAHDVVGGGGWSHVERVIQVEGKRHEEHDHGQRT